MEYDLKLNVIKPKYVFSYIFKKSLFYDLKFRCNLHIYDLYPSTNHNNNMERKREGKKRLIGKSLITIMRKNWTW